MSYKGGGSVSLDASGSASSVLPWTTQQAYLACHTLPYSWQVASRLYAYAGESCFSSICLLFTSGWESTIAEEVQFLKRCLHLSCQYWLPWGPGWKLCSWCPCRGPALVPHMGMCLLIQCEGFVVVFRSSCLWRFTKHLKFIDSVVRHIFLLPLHRLVLCQGYSNTSLSGAVTFLVCSKQCTMPCFSAVRPWCVAVEVLLASSRNAAVPKLYVQSQNFSIIQKIIVASFSLHQDLWISDICAHQCQCSALGGFGAAWLLTLHSFPPVFLVYPCGE